MQVIESEKVLSQMKASIAITVIAIVIFAIIGIFYETFLVAAVIMFIFTFLAEVVAYIDMKRMLYMNSLEK